MVANRIDKVVGPSPQGGSAEPAAQKPAGSAGQPAAAGSGAASHTAGAALTLPDTPAGWWELLLAQPQQFYDNRARKASQPGSKQPDFRHISSGTGLWLDNRATPRWAVDKIAELDAAAGVAGAADAAAGAMEGQTDGAQGDGGGSSSSPSPSPSAVPSMAGQDGAAVGSQADDARWSLLFEDPAQFWDLRGSGESGGAAFRHQAEGWELVLRAAPAWAIQKLRQLEGEGGQEGGDGLDTSSTAPAGAAHAGSLPAANDSEGWWRLVAASPQDFFDNRARKAAQPGSKQPDFKHRASGTGLWVDNRATPTWAKEQFKNP